jgi:hypothetical protein
VKAILRRTIRHNWKSLLTARPRSEGGLAYSFLSVFAVLCSLVTVVPTTSYGQNAPAGSIIDNTVGADFMRQGNSESELSNTVTTRVLPMWNIQLSPLGTIAAPAFSLVGVPGDTLYCRFFLDNLGNSRDSVLVNYQVVGLSTASLGSVIYFLDVNGNGVFDSGEDDPSFLGLGIGAGTPLDVGVVLPTAGGVTFVELGAASAADTTGTIARSVFLVTNNAPLAGSLHLGPDGNAPASPGGEGSSDDVTRGPLGYSNYSLTFTNDLFNAGGLAETVALAVSDSIPLPFGVSVSFTDSAGVPLPPSPSDNTRFVAGTVPPGETHRVQTTVSSSTQPLYQLLGGNYDLIVLAEGLIDTTQQNLTIARIEAPQQVSPGAVLTLNQTFRQGVASAGDVVSLVVTVTNITDSLRVDNVVVSEFLEAQLNFRSSPDFLYRDGRLTWAAGSLAGGESRSAVIKAVPNSRLSTSWAKAVGNTSGSAETGDPVGAGPVVSAIKIENDIFSAEGIILGEVYVDEDGNGKRDIGERGIPGAAVYLESGEYAITDSLGVFSLKCPVSPRLPYTSSV